MNRGGNFVSTALSFRFGFPSLLFVGPEAYVLNFATIQGLCLVSRVVSMGQRNTRLEPALH